MKAAEFLKGRAPSKARIFVVSGGESFLREQVVQRIVEGLPEEVEVEVLRGTTTKSREGIELAELLDDLRTASLFGQERLLHLKDADLLVKEEGKKIARFIEEGQAVHRLILEGDALVPKASKKPTGVLAAVLSQGGVHVQCDPLYATPFKGRGPAWQSPLSQWVQVSAQQRGKRMSLETAWLLHRTVGTGLRELDGEIQKLVLYVKDRAAITEDDVQGAIGQARQTPVFELAESVAGRDLGRALEQSEALFERGLAEASGSRSNSPESVAMTALMTVSSRLRKVARALEMMESGATLEEAGRAIRQSGFFLDKLRAQIEQWRAPTANLGRVLEGVERAESDLKHGVGPARAVVDRFLVESLRDRVRETASWRR